VHLQSLKRLKTLVLRGTPITDAGLEHLKGLTRLRELWVGRTRVTEAGAGGLEAALPDLEVVW
jgi:hypothetical protein